MKKVIFITMLFVFTYNSYAKETTHSLKSYIGSIANKYNISMFIKDNIRGYYKYHSTKLPIDIGRDKKTITGYDKSKFIINKEDATSLTGKWKNGNKKYDFTLRDGKCLSGKLCSYTVISYSNNEGYDNEAIYFDDLGVYDIELSQYDYKLPEKMSKEKTYSVLQEDAKAMEGEYSSHTELSYFDNNFVCFKRDVSYYYAGNVHPSFYSNGSCLDINRKTIKSFKLQDLIVDSPASRKMIIRELTAHFDGREEYSYNEEDVFGGGEYDIYNYTIFEQHAYVTLNEIGISIRYLLGEAGRSQDYFSIPFEKMKPFATGDFKKMIEGK